jgi:hypothetical protein
LEAGPAVSQIVDAVENVAHFCLALSPHWT